MNLKNIDWLNHSIAFGASVIGIFIAFQLDDWQERSSRREDLEVALRGIKMEIESNLNVYQKNDSLLQKYLDYADFYVGHGKNGMLRCSRRELEKARKVNPERFAGIQFIKQVNDTISLYSADFYVDIVPFSGITTGNWEAAKSSGVLAYLDHERITQLSQVYDWTTKKLGVSDEELANNFITLQKFGDVDKILGDYRLIMEASRMKHRRMREYYEKIKW
jgi:hypothetical protein